MTRNTDKIPVSLSFITVAYKDTGLVSMPQTMPDMVTDGCWGIKREALKNHPKLPKYILEALNQTIESPNSTTLESLYEPVTWVAIEPEKDAIRPVPTFGNKKVPAMDFKTLDEAERRITLNARSVKLLWEMFPGCDWYAHGNSSRHITALCDKQGIVVAILAPILTK